MNKQITIRDLIFWAAIIIAIILFVRTCTPKFGGLFGSKTDTIQVLRDTITYYTVTDTQYIPKLTTLKGKIVTMHHRDTIRSTDTIRLIERPNERAFYSDKQLVAGGSVLIEDSVYQNRITYRKLTTDLPTTTITNTITLKENRNVVYAGLGAIGNKDQLSVGGDLSLKTRNDNMYSAGAYISTTGSVQYQFGYKVPIRLKRRK